MSLVFTPVVHIVDDDPAVLDSLGFLLSAEGWEIRKYQQAEDLLRETLPDSGCILTDFNMPGMDGLQLQASLAANGVALPVIVMTGCADIPVAVRAMKAGAVDFLEKPFPDDDLREAIKRALDQSRVRFQAASTRSDAVKRLTLLTPREVEVMDLLVVGRTTKEIAATLAASPRTIDVHRARVLQKLQVKSLPDLVHLVLSARSAPRTGL